MNKSMRGVLCMLCMCLSVPLFGMERLKAWVGMQPVEATKKLTIEDQLNRAANGFFKKCVRAWYQSGSSRYLVSSSIAVGLAGADTLFIGSALLIGNTQVGKKMSAEKRWGVILGAAGVGGALCGGLAYKIISRNNERHDRAYAQKLAEIVSECLVGLPDILNVQIYDLRLARPIDESKLTDEAKALLAELKKRAEAKGA